MSRIVTRACFLLAGRLLLVGILVGPLSGVTQADSSATAFSGQATVVNATAPVIGSVTVSDTGRLPPSGGSQEVSLLNASIPSLLAAEVLHATTIGQGDRSRSEASVANVTLSGAGHTVTADFLMSRAMAVCGPGGASASGSSEIVGLAVDNQTITVTGQANQTVMLPDGTIVINEQQSKIPGDITVTALDVTVSTPAGNINVVISSAHADITCPVPPGQVSCTGGDFVTGGGWITSPSGAKANFAAAGGIKQGAFWGHLEYIDHGNGLKVKGTGVTAYTPIDSVTRRINGTADIGGMSGTYQVDVADNGEPGRGTDTFKITLSTGYSVGGTLGGGNIQLHTPCA